MPERDILDMHDVEPGIDKPWHAAPRRLDDQAAGRRRLNVARTDRRRRIDNDSRQRPLGDELADYRLRLEFRALIRADHVLGPPRRLLIGRPALDDAERRDAARIDDAFDAGGERRQHQLARSPDIGTEHRFRIGHPEPVIGCHMKQIPAARDSRDERSPVLERALRDFDRQTLQITPIAARPRQYAHRMSGLEQDPRDRRADKAGRSGHETKTRWERHHRTGAARIQSLMRCTTAGSMPRYPCGDIASQGSDWIWSLATMMTSVRGERAMAAATLVASLGGVTLQVSPWFATIRAGTAIKPESLSNTVSPERLGRVTDEDSTTPAILLPRCAAPFAAAVDPWLVPTSQIGTLARERAKSTARPIAAT